MSNRVLTGKVAACNRHWTDDHSAAAAHPSPGEPKRPGADPDRPPTARRSGIHLDRGAAAASTAALGSTRTSPDAGCDARAARAVTRGGRDQGCGVVRSSPASSTRMCALLCRLGRAAWPGHRIVSACRTSGGCCWSLSSAMMWSGS